MITRSTTSGAPIQTFCRQGRAPGRAADASGPRPGLAGRRPCDEEAAPPCPASGPVTAASRRVDRAVRVVLRRAMACMAWGIPWRPRLQPSAARCQHQPSRWQGPASASGAVDPRWVARARCGRPRRAATDPWRDGRSSAPGRSGRGARCSRPRRSRTPSSTASAWSHSRCCAVSVVVGQTWRVRVEARGGRICPASIRRV